MNAIGFGYLHRGNREGHRFVWGGHGVSYCIYFSSLSASLSMCFRRLLVLVWLVGRSKFLLIPTVSLKHIPTYVGKYWCPHLIKSSHFVHTRAGLAVTFYSHPHVYVFAFGIEDFEYCSVLSTGAGFLWANACTGTTAIANVESFLSHFTAPVRQKQIAIDRCIAPNVIRRDRSFMCSPIEKIA